MEFLVKPWKHQEEALRRTEKVKEFALFFEQGCGKTATSINISRRLYATHAKKLRTLILAPIIVVDNWAREFKLHSKIPGKLVVPLMGSGQKKLKTIGVESSRGAFIFITNYEALANKELFCALKEWGPQVIVCDESHRLKDSRAQRTKKTTELADLAVFKYILTGTPILNSALDIFSQYRILDGGATFGTNYFAFRATYFYDKNAGMPKQQYFPKWVPRPSAHVELNRKIYKKAMRVLKKDCLDLPPLVRQEIYVELSSDQKKHYDEMKKDFITFLSTKACTAELALTKALRLQQIVSGFLKFEDGVVKNLDKNPRIEALSELLETLTPEHKVIVWCVFKENYKQIALALEKLKIKHTFLTGEQNHAAKIESVDKFRRDHDVRVIVANPSAGGVGINLVEASYSIFYSRNFSLENDLQAEARNYRGGSEIHQKVTRIDIVAPKTIDELVLKALSTKQKISDEVLSWRL